MAAAHMYFAASPQSDSEVVEMKAARCNLSSRGEYSKLEHAFIWRENIWSPLDSSMR